jgi:hypothetical protein
MVQAHTKSLLGYGAGLLSLCLGATVLFFTLKPGTDSLQDFPSETRKPQSVVKTPSPSRSLTVESKPATHYEYVATIREEPKTSQPQAPQEREQDEENQPTVEVLEPGKIRLTEEQTDLLKGRGAAWGQANAEAEAVLRAIPKEAFTSDW